MPGLWAFALLVCGFGIIRVRAGELLRRAGLLERFIAIGKNAIGKNRAVALAFRLKLVELPAVFLDRAVDALLIESEPLEFAGVVEKGPGPSEGGVDFGVPHVDGGGFREVAQSQHVVLHGADALQTPEVLGDERRELDFDRRLRLEAVDEFLTELVMRGAVFHGHDADLAGDAVAQSVQRGFGFTFGRARSGGALRVLTIGLDPPFGD